TVLRDGRLVETVRPAESSPRAVAHLMVGREIENASNFPPRTPGTAVLEARKLSLPWPGHAQKCRLREINLTVHAGEVLGIAGLMGAGRTELLECLFGSSRLPPTGEILLNGRAVVFRHPADALAAGVALVTEDRKRLGLFDQLNVGQNITLGNLRETLQAGPVHPRAERRLRAPIRARPRLSSPGAEAPTPNRSRPQPS